jgi:Putative DNA-binding domain
MKPRVKRGFVAGGQMSTPATAISTSSTIEPRRSSVSEVEEICKSGELERLIGIVEDRYIEFKLQLNIKQAEFKLKLAKSIASFANADGGILVIGVATTRDVQTRRDFAESLNYLEGTIDLGSYYKEIVPPFKISEMVSVTRIGFSEPALSTLTAMTACSGFPFSG